MALTTYSSPNEFTTYHMKCINGFKWTSLARSVIHIDGNGNYYIKPSPILAQLIFYVYFINTSAKVLFLCLMVTGHFGAIEFLDKICGMDYILCGTMVVISYVIWQRNPLYEIIYRLWEIENRIYKRLNRPQKIRWEAQEEHSITLWAHAILTVVGCCSLTIQFYMAPKYCVFTYSLLEADNSYLRIIFCFHESLFLSHAWFAMACSNGLCTFEAVNLSLLITQMSKTVDELKLHDISTQFKTKELTNEEGLEEYFHYTDETTNVTSFPAEGGKVNKPPKFHRFSGHRNTPAKRGHKEGGIHSAELISDKPYDIEAILYDYQQLMLISERFNDWVGYKIVGLSICAFCQYISSTCMAFQVLRMPGSTISDVWFYIQDCMVASYVTFRVFDYMSIVFPASEKFMRSVQQFMAHHRVVGGHIRKFQRTLRLVSLKLGPNPLRREAVLNTMEMLASYYVCVALW